jgi:precorrin-4 methylase
MPELSTRGTGQEQCVGFQEVTAAATKSPQVDEKLTRSSNVVLFIRSPDKTKVNSDNRLGFIALRQHMVVLEIATAAVAEIITHLFWKEVHILSQFDAEPLVAHSKK